MIGAGIGGTSAAYFLRQKFGPEVRIDVFERGEVGGRLATVRLEGRDYEAGGAVLHPLNLHMKQFVKELGEASPAFLFPPGPRRNSSCGKNGCIWGARWGLFLCPSDWGLEGGCVG